jgi:predicted AlkP superfamily phosphohydrolase/phosphomutase
MLRHGDERRLGAFHLGHPVSILCVALLAIAGLLAACGTAPEIPSRGTRGLDRPIFLFGVNGLEWNVMLPMIREGDLPVLARLMEAGTYGELETMSPTLSPVIWTSVVTGKLPHKHGILHFVAGNLQSGDYRLLSNRDRKTKAIWNIFSDFERTVHSFGWWMTFPAEPVSGSMVA